MQVAAAVRNLYREGAIDAILTNRSDSGRSHTQSSRIQTPQGMCVFLLLLCVFIQVLIMNENLPLVYAY
jgi:hypothetical protein